ncbi:cupin-like domain-containing protein [Chytriomyces cf. hyalinus JEL632]|nr:cupin-like domain-containing protein [Chytriomyces cf. hyalinus JEL632]
MEAAAALQKHCKTARSLGSHAVHEVTLDTANLESILAKNCSRNRVTVFRQYARDWDALSTFVDRDWLERTMDTVCVDVAVTENGLADAVVDDVFCLPAEENLPFKDFIHRISTETESDPVHYYQAQNNNLREECAALFDQVPASIDFADKVFGSSPEAVNFWCGSHRAVTSFHKDHYENLYAVISGTKTFHLIPPTESWALEERTFPTSQYTPPMDHHTSTWSTTPMFIDAETGAMTTQASKTATTRMKTRWCSLDPTSNPKHAEIFAKRIGHTPKSGPLFLTVTLHRGDMLYLPALWAHKVEQRAGVDGDGSASWLKGAMAVNYWYDMDFSSPAFVMHSFLRRIAAGVGCMEPDIDIEDSDDESD